MTDEHVLREKWQEEFGSEAEELLIRRTYNDQAGTRTARSPYTGVALARTAKCVCGNCNSGWMNALEEEAEGIVRALVLGESFRLTHADLSIVNRWVAKTSFVMEWMGGSSPKACSEDQRRAVMDGNEPERFHVFMFPIEPDTTIRLRTSPLHSVPTEDHAVICVTSIKFRQVHFLSITGHDNAAENVILQSDLGNLLGFPTWAHADGLDWPDGNLRPVSEVQRLHNAVMERINYPASG